MKKSILKNLSKLSSEEHEKLYERSRKVVGAGRMSISLFEKSQSYEREAKVLLDYLDDCNGDIHKVAIYITQIPLSPGAIAHLALIAHKRGIAHHKSDIDKNQLAPGRIKGSESNKARAAAIKSLALQFNDEVLKNPDTARWGIEKRANHIELTFRNRTIAVNGKPYPATMVNGKKYAVATIAGWITGT